MNEDHDSIKRKVNQIDLETGKVIATFNSITEAGEQVLNDKTAGKTISNICRGIRPSYGGYGWQYAEDIGKPIYLNKQVKQIYLPEYDLFFENKMKCAEWFIENNICRSKIPLKVEGAICYALKHSGKYFGITLEEREKVIYTYYDTE